MRYKPLARHWRETLEAVDWPVTVVANADDPIVTGRAGREEVVWVAGGDEWSEDGAICRDCIVRLRRDGERWWCDSAARSAQSRAGGWSETSPRGPASRCRSSWRCPGA